MTKNIACGALSCRLYGKNCRSYVKFFRVQAKVLKRKMFVDCASVLCLIGWFAMCTCTNVQGLIVMCKFECIWSCCVVVWQCNP